MRKIFTNLILPLCLFVSIVNVDLVNAAEKNVKLVMGNVTKKEDANVSDDAISPYIIICDDAIERQIANKNPEIEIEDINNKDISIIDADEKDIKMLEKQYGDNIIIEENKILKASSKKQTHGIKNSTKQRDKNKSWNMKMINTQKTVESVSNNKVKIAVLDSGVNYTPDIKVTKSVNFIDGETCENPFFIDASGHGLSVAGVISDCLSEEGIQDNVEIYSARVLDDDGNAPVSRIIEAICWAMENDVDIINMSFGTESYSYALEKAVKEAYDNGILLIASAGNGNVVEYPAAFEEVVSVGSVGPDGEVSEFGASEEEVELFAPGECIQTAGMFEETEIYTGTSVAAPHVAGAAASLFVENRGALRDTVRETLQLSANPIDGRFTEDSYGLVDVENAKKVFKHIQRYGGDTPCTIEKKILHGPHKEVGNYEDDIVVRRNWKKHNVLTRDVIENMCKAEAYQAVIDGARYPDDYCNLSDHPELHGGGITTSAYNGTNYVACYCLMIRCANELYSYENNNNGKRMTKSELKLAVGNEYYSNALKGIIDKYGESSYKVMIDEAYDAWYINKSNGNNKTYCRRFLYGIGMHILSDSFAHSAYKDYNYVWTHLNHNMTTYDYLGADNPQVCVYRYETAREGIANTWNRLKGSNRNSSIYMDYYCPVTIGRSHFTYEGSYADMGYLMKGLAHYVTTSAGGIDNMLWARFASIDRDVYYLNYGR